MRAFRSLLVPALLGLILLTIAFVTRSGYFARKNPGVPINSAMREAMHMMVLPPEDEATVRAKFPTAQITSTGLRYVVRQPGDGITRPQRGQTVAVTYRGTLLDGTPIDDSFKNGAPFEFAAGQSAVIPGWDEAIMDMSVGEERMLVVPFWLAYGEKGVKGHIPPQATLIFDVTLVAVK